MLSKEIELKDVIKYLKENNKDNDYLDYLIEESCTSKEWYEAILEKVLKYKPKRVVDIGCCLGLFAYLFANKDIEYIGVDIGKDYNRFETDKIKFIADNYYNVKDKFKDDIIVSCLCIGYLIPVKDVVGKTLIVNDGIKTKEGYKCTAKAIIRGGK